MTLATFDPFSQTALFQSYFSGFNWPFYMTLLMVFISGLMVSHVLYPVMPKFGFRTRKGLLTLAFMLTCIALALTVPAYFFFPFAILYLLWGVVKSLVLGFFELMPDLDPLLDEEETGDEAGAELRDIDYDELGPPDPRGGSAMRRIQEEER